MAREHVVPLSRIQQVASMLSPRVRQLIESALRKHPSQLTPAEKRALILLELLLRGPVFLSDVARESHRVPRYVESWARNPGDRDIPGVDTPDARRIAERIWRALKTGGLRAAEQIVLNG